jgi:uncharacterized membrane protein
LKKKKVSYVKSHSHFAEITSGISLIFLFVSKMIEHIVQVLGEKYVVSISKTLIEEISLKLNDRNGWIYLKF